MAEPSSRLDIGWSRISDVLSLKSNTSVGVEDDVATVIVNSDALREPGIAYLGEASIHAILNRSDTRVFTGLVDKVEIADDIATIRLVGNKREFKESVMGQLVVAEGNDPRKLIYSILRINGWPANRTSMQGWTPGPTERFLVAAPLHGAVFSRNRTFGMVDLVKENPCILSFPATEIWDRFSSAEGWAITTIEADTLFDAEFAGLEQIDQGISAIRALGGFRYPQRNGVLIPFERDQARAKVRISDDVFVTSISSRRHWLRNIHAGTKLELLNIDALVPETIEPENFDDRGQMFVRSVREWKKAADSLDDAERISCLWRSIECFASRGKKVALFKREELKLLMSVQEKAASWSGPQKSALELSIRGLNSMTLRDKFRQALDAGGIALSAKEFDAIMGTRDLRNDLEHGRSLSEPEHRSLDNAIEVMNYVLTSLLAQEPSVT